MSHLHLTTPASSFNGVPSVAVGHAEQLALQVKQLQEKTASLTVQLDEPQLYREFLHQLLGEHMENCEAERALWEKLLRNWKEGTGTFYSFEQVIQEMEKGFANQSSQVGV